MQPFKQFYLESTTNTKIAYFGFAGRGCTVGRYTLVDRSVNLNSSKKVDYSIGEFEEDEDEDSNVLYNSITEAVKAFTADAEWADILDIKGATTAFVSSLFEHSSIVVIVYNNNNHFEEPAKLVILNHPYDNWKDVTINNQMSEDKGMLYTFFGKFDPDNSSVPEPTTKTSNTTLDVSNEPLVQIVLSQLHKRVKFCKSRIDSVSFTVADVEELKELEQQIPQIESGIIDVDNAYTIVDSLATIVHNNSKVNSQAAQQLVTFFELIRATFTAQDNWVDGWLSDVITSLKTKFKL